MKNIILEEIIKELILESKTPEQVLELLVRKYPQEEELAKNIIWKLMSIDPTKKYSYTQWAVLISNSLQDIENNLQNFKDLFNFARNNNEFQLQTFKSLNEAILGMNDFKGRDEYEIAFENNYWIIYIPNTYAASRYIVHHLYDGATWCTASSNGDYHFKHYTENGDKLYILANKQTKEIYQYSPQTNEFHDNYNCQVDSPSELVGNEVYNWFEQQGLDIDEGCFPGPEDIYNEGNYGLRCINDLYRKYVICDSHGHNIDMVEGVIWSPISLDEYENAIVIETVEDHKKNWYVYDTTTWKCTAYFNDDVKEPYFWGRGSVFGLGDNDEFYHVSLCGSETNLEIDDVDDFEKVDCCFVLEKTDYEGGWILYNYVKNCYCTYIAEDGEDKDVRFDYEPSFNESTNCFEGEDLEGNEITYNPYTGEYKILGDNNGLEEQRIRNIIKGVLKEYKER